MTITSEQQATSSAIQFLSSLKAQANYIQPLLNNGLSSNKAAGLPGFSANDMAVALGGDDAATKLKAAIQAILNA